MTNKKYFFIGIGGIGMSSIAQYLYEKENTILGYDASENKSVKILEKKGIEVTNKLSLKSIPDYMKKDDVIVVYTPAIPDDNIFLKYFRANGNKDKVCCESLGLQAIQNITLKFFSRSFFKMKFVVNVT